MWKRMLGSRSFYIVAVILMVAAFLASQIEMTGDLRPAGDVSQIQDLDKRDDLNVLFLLIDTVRADRLSTYGYERETSPVIDTLAATGVRFAHNVSQSSWTKCSMASLWTGLNPVRADVTRSPQAVSLEAKMPAEILKEAGYQTYALWRNGWVGPNFGFHQGFDVYHSPLSTPIPARLRREKPNVSVRGTDQDAVRSALEFLRVQGDERWFLYLHLMDVHQYVYDTDTSLFGTSYSDIYDNSIRWTDRVIGSLLYALDERDLRKKTLIVLASDHGEAFGEHGREGHARDVYGEVTTTPLIMSFPFRLDGGVVVNAETANIDLWPTLLDILGLDGLLDPDGRSRLNDILVAGGMDVEPVAPAPRFAHLDQNWGQTAQPERPHIAVNDGPYRLLTGGRENRTELFNKSVDPGEQNDISKEEPDTTERLREIAKQYLLSRPAAWGAAPEVGIDPGQLEQLRALGYSVE
jgi:arylsulfatase A-like enzyme